MIPHARRAIVTMGTGRHAELLDLALPTFRRFAQRNGYEIIVASAPNNLGRPDAWAKIPILKSNLRRYDIVLWLDADLAIVSYDTDPADALGPNDYQALVETRLPDEQHPNTGVWLIRAGDRAQRFLDAVWAQEDCIHDNWWEQAAVCRLLGYSRSPSRPERATEWQSGTTWLDEGWNSVLSSGFSADARIRHYAGRPLGARKQALLADSKLIKAAECGKAKAAMLRLHARALRLRSELIRISWPWQRYIFRGHRARMLTAIRTKSGALGRCLNRQSPD